MIVIPITHEDWSAAVTSLAAKSGTAPCADMKIIGWTEDNKISLIVGFSGFMGRLCQIHVAMEDGYHFTPRAMLVATFDYAFNQLGREKLIGIVNSKNTRAMRYDKHLGFVEEHRIHGMHDEGGDVVIFGMTRAQCRYLSKERMSHAI